MSAGTRGPTTLRSKFRLLDLEIETTTVFSSSQHVSAGGVHYSTTLKKLVVECGMEAC